VADNLSMCLVVFKGTGTVSWHVARTVHFDNYRPCTLPSQASVWKIHPSDSACPSSTCMDVLCTAIHYFKVRRVLEYEKLVFANIYLWTGYLNTAEFYWKKINCKLP
jgi:hypothetical protein